MEITERSYCIATALETAATPPFPPGVVKASALTVTLTVMASLSGCGLDGSPLSGEKPLADKVSVTEASDSDLLNRVLDQQSDSVKTRYAFRHPAETLSFFGIKPGMTVVETDPGGGW